MQTQTQESLDMNEMSLREHLLAAQAAQAAQAQVQPTTPEHLRQVSPGDGSHHDHNIDPVIAAHGGYGLSPEASGGEGSAESKRAKRELSTSKRAAQNRAAQRAFRQRKEGYIKKLEEQVRDFHTLENNYKAVQAENYQLRDYVINLQSRLLESQGDYPQPPPAIDLQNPRDQHSSSTAAATLAASLNVAPNATMGPAAVSQLQAAAAAAQAGEFEDSMDQTRDEDSQMNAFVHTDEEGINNGSDFSNSGDRSSRPAEEDLPSIAQAAAAAAKNSSEEQLESAPSQDAQ